MTNQIFIPTYSRKNPLILNLVDSNPSIRFNFCVRGESLDSGFYNDFPKANNIRLVNLGYGIQDLGDTRERIINYCFEKRLDYCVMSDDGISEIVDLSKPQLNASGVLDEAKYIMETDKLHEYVVGFSFGNYKLVLGEGKTVRTNTEKEKEVYYLQYPPTQLFVLNLHLLQKYNINFASIKERGIEDAAFIGQCFKNGLIFCSRSPVCFSGPPANNIKAGGSHIDNETLEHNEKRYDEMVNKCIKYLHMYGTSQEKSLIPGNQHLTRFGWDLGYFRRTLCLERDKYQWLIDSHFEIPDN